MKLIKKTQGVIMMETLLTLPVYIVMLAGLFWIAEVCLIQLAMVEGERFSLWQKGNRHTTSAAGPYMFWFLSHSSKEEDQFTSRAISLPFFREPIYTADDWGQINSGYLKGTTKRDGWSLDATNAVGKSVWAESLPGYKDTFSAMEIWGSRTRNIMLLSRRKISTNSNPDITNRSGDKSYNNRNLWHGIAVGYWNDFVIPESIGLSSAINAYTRNANYVYWSN